MTMITPTVGRVVWYHDSPGAPELAAIVCAVQEIPKGEFIDAHFRLALAVFDSRGMSRPRVNVRLVQDGEEPPTGSEFAEWMPYQKGQAAKTEQLEAKLQPQSEGAGAASKPAKPKP